MTLISLIGSFLLLLRGDSGGVLVILLLLIFGGIYTFIGLVWAVDRIKKIPENLKEIKNLNQRSKEIELHENALKFKIERSEMDLQNKKEQFEEKIKRENKRFEEIKAESVVALDKISKEKALGFPWLATALSDYRKLYELKLANALENKSHPAQRAADEIRAMAVEKTFLRRENKILRELHRYYEYLFPWLIEFKGEDLDELIRQVNQPRIKEDQNEDPVTLWLSDAEWDSDNISRTEKYQRALDRYWKSKKSSWQLGRDYERYIGYLYESKGYKVEYHGIEFGFEDMGRDLICIKGNDIRVIQCKYWAAHKTIHEKHICQLFGTAEAYRLKFQGNGDLFGDSETTSWLYISCSASQTAKEFAKMLDVNLIESFPLQPYPIIKCNVSLRDGSKIYHLPFDQQYDRTLIEFKDEHYVQTVAEAENLGFRRAYRWQGNRQ